MNLFSLIDTSHLNLPDCYHDPCREINTNVGKKGLFCHVKESVKKPLFGSAPKVNGVCSGEGATPQSSFMEINSVVFI